MVLKYVTQRKKLSIRRFWILIFTICSFYVAKNKLDYCKGKDCMKIFFKDLREYAMRIANYEKKK